MKYIPFLSALLTPLIAIITTLIAIQQYRTAKSKLRHDLYERRLKVYKATKEYLYWAGSAQSEGDRREEFDMAIAERQFLFDEELSEWLYKISIHKDYVYGEPSDSEELRKRYLERQWFSHRGQELTGKFMKYLSLKNLR